MLGLWIDLPWWVKVPVSCAMMGWGGYLLWGSTGPTKGDLDLGGEAIQRRDFFFGVVLLLSGLLLAVLSGRTKSEKHGYKF